MIAFIDEQRAVHGVEPICKVLPIAPSTYHERVAQRRDPLRLSARARRDLALRVEVQRVFDADYRVYGVRKVWRQLQRKISTLVARLAERGRLLVRDQTGSQVNTSCERSSG